MIKSAAQLKDYIKNLARLKNANPQILLRMYMMERFLERLSLSKYKNNFIMKGGTLVASMVGVDLRATMDLDVTIKGFTLSIEETKEIIINICSLHNEDNIRFTVKDISNIMDEADYNGLRVSMLAEYERISIPLKIDISTGDVITPQAIEYQYKLLLEDRYIELLSYNLETVLAEKFDTIVERDISNTRMRDFYDIYVLIQIYRKQFQPEVFSKAVAATASQRKSSHLYNELNNILNSVYASKDLQQLWSRYGKNYQYASDIAWNDVVASLQILTNYIDQFDNI